MDPIQDSAQLEQGALASLNAEEVGLQATLNTNALTSWESSSQIQGAINQLNGYLGKFWAYRATANDLLARGRPAYSQKLETLIGRVQFNLQTLQLSYQSKRAYESAMGGPSVIIRPF